MNLKMTVQKIPTHGGFCDKGLPIQRTYCVVFDNKNLKILATAGYHTAAEELANSYVSDHQKDARAIQLSFHHEKINPQNIIGMRVDQFQHFTDNNRHPLMFR